MINQRKNERFHCLVPVEGKQGGLFDRTQTVNISKGGLGFISERKIPLHKQIAIELDLKEEGDPVLVLGKVRWVRSITQTSLYRIGLSFENFFQGSQLQLKQHFVTIGK